MEKGNSGKVVWLSEFLFTHPDVSGSITTASRCFVKHWVWDGGKLGHVRTNVEQLNIKEVYSNFRGGRVKNILRALDRDPSFNLPVIGSLIYCESIALDHAITEAGITAVEEDPQVKEMPMLSFVVRQDGSSRGDPERWLHGPHRTAKVRSNALSAIRQRRCGADLCSHLYLKTWIAFHRKNAVQCGSV
uniref:Uncharacterized protein n=1 Tax=Timema tahoe TaxID=61484 RepID=A0A7R9ICY4_9NEOP|nr:unnamed protein product [Timema tahoe]